MEYLAHLSVLAPDARVTDGQIEAITFVADALKKERNNNPSFVEAGAINTLQQDRDIILKNKAMEREGKLFPSEAACETFLEHDNSHEAFHAKLSAIINGNRAASFSEYANNKGNVQYGDEAFNHFDDALEHLDKRISRKIVGITSDSQSLGKQILGQFWKQYAPAAAKALDQLKTEADMDGTRAALFVNSVLCAAECANKGVDISVEKGLSVV